MKDQSIKKKDWVLLSVYLDGELRDQERDKLETRLNAEPSLAQALNHLKKTRVVLRSSPKIRAPRHFTLTPELVGIKRPQARMYPTFRLASVLASLMLMIVMVGDVFGFIDAPSPLMMMASETEMENGEKAFTAPMAELESAVEESVIEEPAEEMVAVEIESMEDESTMDAQAPELASTELVQPEKVVEEIIESEEGAPIRPTDDKSADTVTTADGEDQVEEADVHVEQSDDREDEGSSELFDDTEITGGRELEGLTEPAPQPGRLIRYIEIALGLTAFITGGAALILRRRMFR